MSAIKGDGRGNFGSSGGHDSDGVYHPEYDTRGFDCHGYDRSGTYCAKYDNHGYDLSGHDRFGTYCSSRDFEGKHH